MIKNILFIILLFFSSQLFSQNKEKHSTKLANDIAIKNDQATKLLSLDKSELNKNNDTIKNKILPKRLQISGLWKQNMTFRWPSPCLHHQQQWEGEVVKAMELVTHPLQVTGAPLNSSPKNLLTLL